MINKMQVVLFLVISLFVFSNNLFGQVFSFQKDKLVIDGVNFNLPNENIGDTNYLLSRFINILGMDYKKSRITNNSVESNGDNLLIEYNKKGISLATSSYHKKYYPDPKVLQIIFFFNDSIRNEQDIILMDRSLNGQLTFDEIYNDSFWKKYITRTSLEYKFEADKTAIWFKGIESYNGLIKFKEVNGRQTIYSISMGFNGRP